MDLLFIIFFFSSRRRHTRFDCDWSSDVCSSDLNSSAEIVGKHLGDPVPVASDVNAKIPRWLSTVIVKCLAKKPEDRFQDADDVLAALDSGRTSGSEGLVGAQTLERQVRRSGQVRRGSGRLGWWVAGGLGAALVAGGPGRRGGCNRAAGPACPHRPPRAAPGPSRRRPAEQ